MTQKRGKRPVPVSTKTIHCLSFHRWHSLGFLPEATPWLILVQNTNNRIGKWKKNWFHLQMQLVSGKSKLLSYWVGTKMFWFLQRSDCYDLILTRISSYNNHLVSTTQLAQLNTRISNTADSKSAICSSLFHTWYRSCLFSLQVFLFGQ